MKLKSLYLKNFRAYQDMKINFDDNLNVIIGQNDIGKSTIIEALDIFFGQEVIKIDISDFCINANSDEIIIGVELKVEDDFELIIDSTNKTNLNDEYLLNGDGYLEIYKKFGISNNKLSSKDKIYIKASYPDVFDIPLINLKIKDLKKKLDEIKDNIDNYNEVKKTISAEIRKVLYNYYIKEDTKFEIIDIDLQKDEGKNIWSALQKELPLYFLFQSDRENKDSDSDIQNPLKSATKQIISEVAEEFEKLKQEIESKLEVIGNETITKMQDMGLDIAENLRPVVNNKNWDSLFSFTLESDDGISLNKRGSGFRRMVLLNYFRVEEEKKVDEKNNKQIIYAFEEPETSQHPNHQKILIESLIKLSQKNNYQIILTTHTPEIAKIVNEDNLIVLIKGNQQPKTIDENDKKLEQIIYTLGIFSTIQIENIQKLKVVICVEGYTDIEFLKNINQIKDFKQIVDLNSDEILMLFLGGGTLEHYINKRYLNKLGIPQIHIYDSDINQKDNKNRHKYKKIIKRINMIENQFAFETKKSEMENYIHPDIIKEHYDFDTIYRKNKNNWLKIWSEDLNIEEYVKEKKANSNTVKKSDFANLAKKLRKEHLIELEAFDEIQEWFEKIKEVIDGEN